MRYTLADMVGMTARSRPDLVAVTEVEPDRSLTYRQLWQRIADLGDAVRGAPVGRSGHMVATLLPNSIDALAIYLGCQRADAAAVPVNTRLTDEEMQHILQDCDARLIVAAGPLLGTAARVAPAEVAILDADTIPTGSVEPDLQGDTSRGDATAVVFYTSGTTGPPKGATMSNDAWVVNTMRWGWQLGIQWDEVELVPGPLFHMSYSSFAIASWLIGGQVRIMREFTAAAACDEFADRATFAFLVPSMTTSMLDEWKARGRPPLSAMRSMMNSGAPVSTDMLAEAFDMFPNAEISETYGWTEAGFANREVKTRDSAHDGTVGYSTIGSDVGVFDENGNPCPPGVRGEVAIRAIVDASEYVSGRAGSNRRGDWIRSGDVGVYDPDGRLRIVDRLHGLIITGGENVFGAEVEAVVGRHPAVRECVVIGLPDARWGEVITAVVVLKPVRTLDLAELREFCGASLADFKCPRRLEVFDELPRNSMAKLQRFAVRARLEED